MSKAFVSITVLLTLKLFLCRWSVSLFSKNEVVSIQQSRNVSNHHLPEELLAKIHRCLTEFLLSDQAYKFTQSNLLFLPVASTANSKQAAQYHTAQQILILQEIPDPHFAEADSPKKQEQIQLYLPCSALFPKPSRSCQETFGEWGV